MNIVHYALYIGKYEYAERIFKELFGLEKGAEFELNDIMSEKIFQTRGINRGIIYKTDNNGILEVFTGNACIEPNKVNHVCFTLKNREKLVKKAKEMGFDVNIIPRESKEDVIFIKDDHGNNYEIKEA